ncbi:ABC transporter permease [Catenovulum sediminis]|uniref:Transport permease protein n=1 Tax=Catenovulum sediminis TaxID=1740262 RepID=A0ABV1RKR4_9ALTE|nr:ABC transporter permease [Catenovulum sediminis]
MHSVNHHVKRTPLIVMRDVTFALFLREIKTRFGAFRLGIFWALAEPMAHVLIFSVIFGVRAREGFGGVETPIFIYTGIMPFLLFQNLFNQCKNACKANQGLFHYRYVKPINTFIARSILETGIFLFTSACLLALFFWVGYQVAINDILYCFMIVFLLIVLSASLGMIGAFMVDFFPESDKILSIAMKPMMFISGIFFTLDMIPPQYHVYLIWNPVLHAVELFRTGFIQYFETAHASLFYLFVCSLTSLFIALRLYRSHWTRMVAT